MNNKALFSSTVAWLRFPLTVMVVLLHTPIIIGSGATIDLGSQGWAFDLKTLFSQGICRVAVPSFFFISGYYFYKGLDTWNNKIWFEKIKKRFHTLLVPYVLWNLISLLFVCVTSDLIKGGGLVQYMDDHGWLRIFWDNNRYNYIPPINILGIEMYNGKPLNFPLWFIRDLLVMVIISPAIRLYLLFRSYGLIVMAVLMFLNIGIPYEGFSMTSVFFFSLGGYYMLYKKDVLYRFRRVELPAAIFSFLLLLLMVFSYGKNELIWGLCHNVFKLFGMITVFNLAGRIVEKRKMTSSRYNFLTASSFFVFCCHAIVVTWCGKLMHIFLCGNSQLFFAVQYVLTFVLTVIVCLLLYAVSNKISSKFTIILTGGR